MTFTTTIVVLLLILMVGALPLYRYSIGWSYMPSGVLAVILAVVALMLWI